MHWFTRGLAASAIGLGISTAALGGIRIELPWGGEIKVDDSTIQQALNPMAYLNPMGIPTQADAIRAVMENPDQILHLLERPGDVVYTPVADAIVSGRNAILANGSLPIPRHIRTALTPFYPAVLMDSVRWSTKWSAIQNTLQAVQMTANDQTQAITLMNTIVFRDPDAADDVTVWAHELQHVKQYAEWGVIGFAQRWVDNSSVTGPVEAPAYEIQGAVRNYLASISTAPVQPIQSGAVCRELNQLIAICDLYGSNIGTGAVFTVQGDAYATGHGSRSGQMRLAIVVDGNMCNHGASKVLMVDNATRATGPDYSCEVVLGRGQNKRVVLLAPNSRADGVYLKAVATMH